MTRCLFILIFTSLVAQLFAQEADSSTRRREASGETVEGGSPAVMRSNFRTLEDCLGNDCPCCSFLGNDSTASDGRTVLDRVIKSVCKRDHSGMEDVEVAWGSRDELTIRSRTFHVYNSDRDQRRIMEEALEVLPDFYLAAVPESIRVGNPKTGSRTAPSSGRIGGGSRRCFVPNEPYEYIIIHPVAFARGQRTNPRMTILHEVGHFVDREYGIAESLLSTHREDFARYLELYHGDSRGSDEVIAQGIMCYYFRKHFVERGLFTTEAQDYIPGRASLFPQWLLDIIEADIESRS